MTDRDTFAAAALTGLLGGRAEPYTDERAVAFAKAAWLLADAMLAAPGPTTDLDAAPAATATKETLTRESDAAGTGDTRAWRRSGNYHRLGCAAVRYSRSDSGPGASECFDRLCDVVDDIVGNYAAPPAPGVQSVVVDMLNILVGNTADNDEKHAALVTLAEALFPGQQNTVNRLSLSATKKELVSLQEFRVAVEHVTENGKTTRSMSSSDGWAVVHKDRLCDLLIAEERLATAAPPAPGVTLTDAEREVLRECADIAWAQLLSAEEGGDEETIARWTRRHVLLRRLLSRAAKEETQ